jgi:hypothetical protein
MKYSNMEEFDIKNLFFAMRGNYIMSSEELNSEFYEEVGDPLAAFRRTYGGAMRDDKGKDPFAKDPDVLQSEREEKLREQESNNRQY